MRRRMLVLGAVLTAAACTNDNGTQPILEVPAAAQNASAPGAVYVMTNQVAGNQIRRFDRNADGTLGEATTYATGGTGTGGGLGSQGAVALSSDGQWLLAVNAGSNDVSVFRTTPQGLELTDREASGGVRPISVTVHGPAVYVLNAGGAGNISGLWLSNQGELSPIAGSTQPLSGPAAGPAQVAFTPAGDRLVVTEKATSQILTYPLDASGAAGAPVVHPSAGTTPFGFAFAGRDRLIVSEAFGGAGNASATSSYDIAFGGFQVVSASVPTTETAACWAVTTQNGMYAYVSNAGSASLTGYAVAGDGTLSILDANGVTGSTNGNPLDAAVNVSSRYLYTINGNGTISAFEIASDGSLTGIGGAAGLPAGSVGIAAH